MPAEGIEDDPVSIGHRGERAKDGVSLEIEDDDCAITSPIADKPTARRRSDRHAVSVLLPRNIGYGRPDCGSITIVWVVRGT